MTLNEGENKLNAKVNECKREAPQDGKKKPDNEPILQIRPRGCIAKAYGRVMAAIEKVTEEYPQP